MCTCMYSYTPQLCANSPTSRLPVVVPSGEPGHGENRLCTAHLSGKVTPTTPAVTYGQSEQQPAWWFTKPGTCFVLVACCSTNECTKTIGYAYTYFSNVRVRHGALHPPPHPFLLLLQDSSDGSSSQTQTDLFSPAKNTCMEWLLGVGSFNNKAALLRKDKELIWTPRQTRQQMQFIFFYFYFFYFFLQGCLFGYLDIHCSWNWGAFSPFFFSLSHLISKANHA